MSYLRLSSTISGHKSQVGQTKMPLLLVFTYCVCMAVFFRIKRYDTRVCRDYERTLLRQLRKGAEQKDSDATWCNVLSEYWSPPIRTHCNVWWISRVRSCYRWIDGWVNSRVTVCSVDRPTSCGSMNRSKDWQTYRWAGERRVGERSIWRDGAGRQTDGLVDWLACMRGRRAGQPGGRDGRDRRPEQTGVTIGCDSKVRMATGGLLF